MPIDKNVIARLRAQAAAATPAPWSACCLSRNNGCAHVMHKDGMVCEVTAGKWGDTYPAIRVDPGVGGKAEAYIEMLEYGEVPVPVAQANKALIAELRNQIIPLLDELDRVRAIAKMEELEHCDPNGTWYEVAQAALKKLEQFERIEAGCDCPKEACARTRAKLHLTVRDMQAANEQVAYLQDARARGRQMSGGYCADRECKDKLQTLAAKLATTEDFNKRKEVLERKAREEIELGPPDVHLTNAVVLLGEAIDLK